MTDDDIVHAARAILLKRDVERQEAIAATRARLYKCYARSRSAQPHCLGKPTKLSQEEALVLTAIERNKFEVEAQQNSDTDRWAGDAECKHHARAGALCMGARSRIELLWGLWGSVSTQGDDVTLTEDHLQGSIVQRDLRDLTRELREQEHQKSE